MTAGSSADTTEIPEQVGERTEETDASETDTGEIPGTLTGATARRVAAATLAVIATTDRDGVQDVSVLSDAECFLRVLDADHLAWPESGVEALGARRANLAESPRVALLLVGSGAGDQRRGLHVNGTTEVVAATDLRETHPDLPVDPVPGRPTDVWVVVEVGDLYALDGDDVPRLDRGAGPPPGASGTSGTGPPRRTNTVALLGVLVVVAILLAAGLIALLGSGSSTTAAPSPEAPPAAPVAEGPTGPPTLFGQVAQVTDPATMTVDVGGAPVRVSVIGLDAAALPQCAQSDALDFARQTLQGQQVTLVPDPTVPATDPGGQRRAYVVLASQLSYTDAAINAGWGVPSGTAVYRPVFDREQTTARGAGVGMFGPPCQP